MKKILLGLLLFFTTIFPIPIDFNAENTQLAISFQQFPATQEDITILTSEFSGTNYMLSKIQLNNCYDKNDLICVRALVFVPETTQNNILIFKRVIVGLAIIEKRNDNELYINYLCIAKEHRKKGIGKQIIEGISHYFKPKRILLQPTTSAIPFYEKIGFTRSKDFAYYCMVRECWENVI